MTPTDPIDDAFAAMHRGNILAAREARIRQLEGRLEAMREAGDAICYVVRNAERVSPEGLIEALEDWQEARNNG